MKRICLLGYFGMKNLGDDALLQSLKENYTDCDDIVYVMNNANILYTFPRLINTDEVISSGGWIENNFQTMLWFLILGFMKILNPNLKIRFLGVNWNDILNKVDFIDEIKLRDFNNFRDLAFSSRLYSKKKKIGIDIVPSYFKGRKDEIVNLICKFENAGFEVFLFPFSTLKRTPLIYKRVESDEDFFERIGQKDKIVREYSPNGMRWVISQMDFMVCCHYHSHVFTIQAKKPFVSIPYSQKIWALAKNMKFKNKVIKGELDGKEIQNIIKRVKNL